MPIIRTDMGGAGVGVVAGLSIPPMFDSPCVVPGGVVPRDSRVVIMLLFESLDLKRKV